MNRCFNRVLAAIFAAMLVFVSGNTLAQSAGFNSSYAVFSINGGADAYYCMQSNTSCGPNPALDGASLGTVSSLILKGAEHNVYKCGGADITSTRMNYRIYPTGSPSGSFTALTIGFSSGAVNGCFGEDQQWKSLTQNVNVLNGLAAGNYTIEIYSDESTTVGTQFLSNSGNNYKATFTVPNIRVNSTGGTTPNATYATFAAALTAINGGTAHTGTITCYVSAGYTETAPAGGFSITASQTSLTFIKSGTGTNPTFTANSSPTAGSVMDAIIKIVGGDNITIDGFTLQENGNSTTTLATNNLTEFGIGQFYTTTTNGAKNNTIRNCTISLNPNYQNAIGIYSTSRHTSTATATADATSTAGLNNGFKVYSNTISNVALGVVYVSVPNTATITESGVDIGGTSAATGNTITFGNNTAPDGNWGGLNNQATGIHYRQGVAVNIQYNTINTVSGGLTRAVNGITISGAPTGVTYTNTVSNNTIGLTITSSGQTNGIDFGYGLSTGTIIGNSNNITINQTVSAAVSSAQVGINAAYASATNTCNSNTITINQTTTGTGVTSSSLTGITVAGAATTINALNNAITFNQTTSSSSAVTSPVNGIVATAVATTLNIGSAGNGNTITVKQGTSGSGSYGSGAVSYIDLGSVAHGTVNVVNNTCNTTGSTIRSTGTLNVVSIGTATLVSLCTVKSNTVNIDRIATSGNINFFNQSSSTPSTPADTLSNNNVTFTNIAGSGTVTMIQELGGPTTPAALNKSICNNTFNISGTNTGTFTGISFGYSTGVNIRGNSFNVSTAGATLTGISTTTGVASTSANTISGNSFSLSSSATSATSITGISCSVGGNFQVFNNTFSALNFTGILTTGGSETAISLNAGSSNNIYNNTIAGMTIGAATSTGSPTVAGIVVGSSTTAANVYKNRIYGITSPATGTSTLLEGIRIAGGTTINVHNNLIGNLNATAVSSNDAIRGINITSTTTSSTVAVYYNTIYLNASSTGTNFGSTGLFHTTSSTATTAALDMRNNNIVNTSTASGTGLAVAYRRSSSTLTNYAGTSNRNNLFGTSALYTDGVTPNTTLAAYKATVSTRDANSINENPSWQSTTGSSADFLKFSTGTQTGLESGAANIVTYTDDHSGTVRQGNPGYVTCGSPAGTGTGPDIGAWELCGTPLPLCSGTPASATITGGNTPICSGASAGTLSLSTTYTDLGITYQWRSSAVSGGPYTTTLGTNASQALGTLTSSTYYICEITCTNSGLTFTTAEKAITVNSLPSVSISPSATTYCTPGGTAITLTASGASTYTWAGTGTPGLSATSGNPITASPTTATTITVTGTDGNGCVNTGNVALTVAANPTGVSATATPATICSGFTSTLNGTANTLNASYSVASTTYALQPITGFTNGPSGDDVISSSITLPFSFSFYGTTYSSIFINTNGQVGFDFTGSSASQQRTAQSLPSSTLPNANISLCWADLNAGSGQIKYGTNGTAPNRIFVISYVSVPFFNGTGTVSGQILLFEGTNKIQVHVTSISDNQAYLKTLGIENATGTLGTAATGRNNTSWTVSTAEAWEFSPAPLTYLWTAPTNLVSPNTASTATTALTSTETFTLKVSNGGCDVTTTTTVTVSSGAAITADPVATSKCVGQTATFSVTATGPGLTYQWRKGGSDINTISNPSAATQTLTLTNVTAGDADTYDVVVTATCGSPATSAGATLTVNALPSVGVTASSSTYCVPGGTAVSLTASGANTYTWAGTGTPGLSATSGNPITATPSTATTITVTGTDGNGCVNTATTALTVSPRVYVNSTTATPSTICSGSTSALNVVAGTTAAYTLSSTTFGLISGTGTNTATGDDALLNTVTLPFNFSFFGNVYSSILIYSNGYAAFQTGVTGSPYVQTIPDVAAPDNFIAISHDDLNVTAAGQISYFTSGTAPNRIFVINYNGVKYYNIAANNGDLTGQIQLFEADGHIEIHVANSNDPTLSAKSLGIENVGGTLGYSPAGRNNTAYNISTPEAWKFVPTGGTRTYAWTPATGLTPSDAVQNPTTPSLTSTTGYNVTVSAGGCSASGATTVTIGTATITAIAGTGGSISPAGETTVNCGTSISYTITPDACYSISDVEIDGVSQGAIGSYTFNNITSGPHFVIASFVANPNASVASVTGASQLCVGATDTYSANSVVLSGGSGSWSSDNNTVATVDPNTGLVTAISAGTAYITYTITGGCGGTVSATQLVTVNPNPSTPTISASGPVTFCAGGSVELISSSAFGYQWNLNGSPIGLPIPSLTVTGSGNYTVTVSNIYGCTATSAATTVTVNPLAANPTATVTQQPTCAVATGSITVTAPLGAGNSYTLDGATTISWPNVTFTGVATGVHVISVSNSFGCFSPATTSVTVDPQPFTPGTPVVTGPANVCQYVGTPTQVTYTATATGNGTQTFNWILPPNVSLVSGQGTNTLVVTFPNPAFLTQANKQLRLTVTNACGTSPLTIYYLQAQTPSTPQPIVASTANVCPSLGTNVPITYTIPKVAGASSYIWNAQSGTTTITHPNGLGANDTTVTVTFTSGFTTSNITVQAVNSCGTSGGRALTITRANPATPGLIAGPVNVCSNIAPAGTAATYTVAQQPTVTSYTWTVPAGAIGLTGQGTNSISFTYPAGYTGGTISVIATNGCGTSTARNLTVSTLSPATPSVIDVIQTTACPNRVFTYSLASMPANATAVNWTYPAGGSVVTQTAFSITIAYPSTAVTGTVTAQAVNNCGASVIRSATVFLPACPPEEKEGGNDTPVYTKGNVTAPVELFEAQVFPNPTVSDFKVRVKSLDKNSQVTVRVLDLQGRELSRMMIMPDALKTFGSNLKPGAYFIEVLQGDKRTVQKLIKL